MQIYKAGQSVYICGMQPKFSKTPPGIGRRFVSGAAVVLCLLLWMKNPGASIAGESKSNTNPPKLLVNGRLIKLVPDGVTPLPAEPAVVSFAWSLPPDAGLKINPLRFRFKLEGYDSDWREVVGQMRVVISFLDQAGNEVGKEQFFDNGQSPGWTGNFESSSLRHRRAVVVVPAEARGFWVTITSAGSPETVGAIAVCDFQVRTEPSTNGSARSLLNLNLHSPDKIPDGWMIDGIRAKMAQMVKIGDHPRKNALAILDDDPTGHAQWNTLKSQSPRITPGENLVIEWNEMFSIGLASPRQADYRDLPPGSYRFFLNPLDLMGNPSDEQCIVAFEVPLPFWRLQWFWVAVMTLLLAAGLMSYRYRGWRRLQMENIRLAHQQSLERERFRIAQDIHDDMGARVTQISLASAMAERNAADPEASRAGFQRITELSRELVTALHDTIWVVNPENDNLEAVGNHLCQLFSRLLSQAGLSCRLEVPPLPPTLPITSHQRHNLSMAVKEITNNIIKHAHATEVRMKISLEHLRLKISIQDDGHGFDPESVKRGSGLGNLKRRLHDIGGSVDISSRQNGGTVVLLQMPIRVEIAKNCEDADGSGE
jgi:signal transduction histidine kinase